MALIVLILVVTVAFWGTLKNLNSTTSQLSSVGLIKATDMKLTNKQKAIRHVAKEEKKSRDFFETEADFEKACKRFDKEMEL